jgi:hypothetical protein
LSSSGSVSTAAKVLPASSTTLEVVPVSVAASLASSTISM